MIEMPVKGIQMTRFGRLFRLHHYGAIPKGDYIVRSS